MRPVFLSFIVAAVFSYVSRAGSAGAAAPLGSKESHFDLEQTKSVLTQLIEKTLKDTGAPSLSIALVRNDSIVWKAAFGYANVRTRTPATPETLYNAASTFKSVTATALMQLAAREVQTGATD